MNYRTKIVAAALCGTVLSTPAFAQDSDPMDSSASTDGQIDGDSELLDGDTDVTDEQNPAGDRYIVLRADGTFESGGQPYGRNTGRWVYNPRTRRLGLDSDLGPDDDSVWSVTIRGDVMTWEGEGSDYARRFTITSRRAD